MRLLSIVTLSLIGLVSCQNNQSRKNATTRKPSDSIAVHKHPSEKTDEQLAAERDKNAERAKRWLVHTIEDFFNKNKSDESTITTATYKEYKEDATNVDLDGGLTEEAFKKKWGNSFDTKYAGMGNGFLISAQDNGKIKVTQCDLIEQSGNNKFVFSVLIADLDYNLKYKRDIEVITSGKTCLIFDVLEYN